MPKTLLISWGVFPGTGGSCIIVNNIAKAFSKEEMAIVGEHPLAKSEKKWEAHLPNLYYVLPVALGKSKKGIRFTRWLSLKRIQKEIEDIIKKEQCDRILAIFPDEFYMYIAYRISRRMNLPFFTWFHNTYLDNRTGILKQLAKFLQPKFFSHARHNFVMSEGMKRFYHEKYPEWQFTPLVHGFKIPKLTPKSVPVQNGKIKFLFSGSINESCLDATVRLFKYILSRSDTELHVFSGNGNILEKLGIAGENLNIHSFMPLSEFEQQLYKYDIMLLPHGFEGMRTEAEYKTIFPTRTVPLLYSNRPILAHSPKGAFLTDFLKENDCAEVVDQKSTRQIEIAINDLVNNEDRKQELVQNAIETAKMFDLNNVSSQLKRVINA